MPAHRLRTWLFLAAYYGFLPIGHAQAWLAKQFRQAGIGFGWPLLFLWWPLRQLYVAGYRLCLALCP